jgi:hypothetical protein
MVGFCGDGNEPVCSITFGNSRLSPVPNEGFRGPSSIYETLTSGLPLWDSSTAINLPLHAVYSMQLIKRRLTIHKQNDNMEFFDLLKNYKLFKTDTIQVPCGYVYMYRTFKIVTVGPLCKLSWQRIKLSCHMERGRKVNSANG